uniref:Uncharacterized protein n=1 Tax=Chelonoidis abingdonii TaxID=106734 RepID=A0A8C0JDZ8_CHEAB
SFSAVLPPSQAKGGCLQLKVVRTYKTSELQKIVKTFRQEPKEGVLRWLVQAKMANPPNPKDANGQNKESLSLYRWLAGAVGTAYSSAGELKAQALRHLGMAWAVATEGMDGPNNMPVTKSTKAAFLRTAPNKLKPSLLAVVMAANGRVGKLAATLMQLETALAGARPKAVLKKGELRVPQRVLWFNLLQVGVPPNKINKKPTANLYKQWMQLPASKRSTGPGRKRTVKPNKPAKPSAPPAKWQLPHPY